jgi:hypothetical protein
LLVLIVLAGVATLVARSRIGGRVHAANAVLAATALLALGHGTYNARGLARGWESKASADMTVAGLRVLRHVNGDPSLEGKLIAAELAPMVALYSGLQVLPVEILTPQEHVREKSLAERAEELERIHRRYHPQVYVMLLDGPFFAALHETHLDSVRAIIDVSPEGARVRTLKVQVP